MTTIFMDNDEFNEQAARTLTAATKGGADLGEASAVAAAVVPGDVASWARQWTRKADEVLAGAVRSLDADDPIIARTAYVRASEYYRQAYFFARTNLDDPTLRSAHTAHVAAFRAAIPLLACVTTIVDIDTADTDGVVVHGYLFRPDDSDVPRPTMIAPAGYDSTAETGWCLNAAAALEHGMNCLVFEGPGQGGVLYERRIPLRADFEAVLTPVIEWLLTQPGTDPAALVLFGRGIAGYLAPRGAASEPSLAALICDPAQYDIGASIRTCLGEAGWARLQNGDPTLEPELVAALMVNPMAANGYQRRMTAHGVTTLSAYLFELSRFNLVGRADQITCPTLALASDGDDAAPGQLQTFVAALSGAPVVDTHVFTKAEGAGGHREGLGQERLEQYVYGWLTGILARTSTPV